MKITLFIVFTGSGFVKIMKRIWENPTSNNCPFWHLLPPDSLFTLSVPLGILSYPHTGDIHTLLPFPESPVKFVIRSKQTDTSTHTIWAEIKDILDALTERWSLDEDHESLFKALLENSWVEANEEEINAWRRVNGGPPIIKIPKRV